MDKMKVEKLKSLNNHKHTTLISYNLILHCLVVLLCLLCSCADHWFPSLCTSVNPISLPNTSFFFQPKCLFIVVNVIVVILVGESKLVGSYSSPTTGIYDDYIQRSQSLRGQYSTVQETNERELETKLTVQIVEYKEKEVMRVEDDQKDGEECALPAQELNKKVEEFIARVNRQRRMEAREVEPPITK